MKKTSKTVLMKTDKNDPKYTALPPLQSNTSAAFVPSARLTGPFGEQFSHKFRNIWQFWVRVQHIHRLLHFLQEETEKISMKKYTEDEDVCLAYNNCKYVLDYLSHFRIISIYHLWEEDDD